MLNFSIKERVEAEYDWLKAHNKLNRTLVIITSGQDAASKVYVRNKVKAAEKIGVKTEVVTVSSKVELYSAIPKASIYADGIIVQLPLPKEWNVTDYELKRLIPSCLDVDGFTNSGLYTACTPKGITTILRWLDINVRGKVILVLGRSMLVGKPLVDLLIDNGATVISANSTTPIHLIKHFFCGADIIVSAIGKPKHWGKSYFDEDCHNWCKKILIDVGINRDENGKLCGDFDYDFWSKNDRCEYITPVPGGVGLTTVLSLMENVVLGVNKNV